MKEFVMTTSDVVNIERAYSKRVFGASVLWIVRM